jgi:hypothetical protein
MRILIIIFLFITTNVLGQEKSDELSLLYSNGKTPKFLENYEARFYLPQDTPWIKGIKKDKKAFYLDQLYASNMIVFGDPVSKYCSDLLVNLTTDKYSIYLLRNDAVATFSDSTNIFITTGLISRLTNEAQLMFFLAREIEIMKSDFQPLYAKAESKVSLENMISELSSFSLENEMKLDQQAFDIVKSKNLYAEVEIISAFDVLTYQNRPFYEHSFDIQYFNNGHAYIPESRFFLLQKPNPKEYDFEGEFPELVQRIKPFSSTMGNAGDLIFKNDKNDFKHIVNIARHESIVLSVLKANFLNAIYEIYALEKLGQSSAYLDKLKAAAWWGYINQEEGNIQIKNYTPYSISDSKGAVFMRFISMQTKPVKITLGLRTLKDLTDAYPESKAIARMFNDLIEIAAKSTEFEIADYRTVDLISAIKQFNSKDSLNKKDKELLAIESQEQKSKGVDSANYHLLMIPDLVTSKEFQENYKMYRLGEVKNSNQTPYSIAITNFSLVKFEKKKDAEISNKMEIINDAYQIATEKTGIVVSEFNSTENYNLNYLINSVFIQNYYFNNYRQPVQSPFSDELAEILQASKADIVGVCLYEHAYEPRYKPFHLLGLLGITLPYVIPEFFYSGNKAIFSSLYFDPLTGTTKGMVYNRFNDPFNKRIIQNSFLESISKSFSNND